MPYQCPLLTVHPKLRHVNAVLRNSQLLPMHPILEPGDACLWPKIAPIVLGDIVASFLEFF